ncbi:MULTISPECIES: hypothetical protein [unclassified Moorena]|nr:MULTISPECIES: hypothetical protein [unclassified Moorena]
MQATSPPDSTTILAGFHALSDPLRLAVIELLFVKAWQFPVNSGIA